MAVHMERSGISSSMDKDPITNHPPEQSEPRQADFLLLEKGSNIFTNLLIYPLLSPCRGWSERGQIRFIKKRIESPKRKEIGTARVALG